MRPSILITSCILNLVSINNIISQHLRPARAPPTDLPCRCCNSRWASERTVRTPTNAVGHAVIPPMHNESATDARAVTGGLLSRIVAVPVAWEGRGNA
jgi:hypothetical protein